VLTLSIGPGYLFSDSLSNFNWITWINPNSKILTIITGGSNGLGLNPLPTLDWNRLTTDVRSSLDVSDKNQPFVTPFFANLNSFLGALFFGLLILLPMYLRNIWYFGYLPFNMNRPFDRYGKNYNISLVVDEHANLVQEKYEAYSVYLLSYNLIVASVCFRRICNCLHLLLRFILFYNCAHFTI
jgi:hypothetical protein